MQKRTVYAVPIGFAFVLYDRALGQAETRSLESLTRIVANHGSLLDARIGEVRDTIDLVLVNAEVRSVFRDPESVVFRYRAARSLREFVMGSRFVSEVILFLLEDDIVLSGQYSVTNPARFYGGVFGSYPETYSAFAAALSQRSFAKEYGLPLFLATDGSVRRMESWVQTVPELESRSPAVVMVLVDHLDMQSAVRTLVPLTGSAWLADASGAVVVTHPDAEAESISHRHASLHREPVSRFQGVAVSGYVTDGGLATVFTTLADSGWTYHLSVPIDDDLLGVPSLRVTFFVTTALAVLTGGLLSLFLARRFGRPVGETLTVLESRNPAIGLGSVGSLRSAVQDVVHENQRHSDYIIRNLPIIRTNLIYRVLTGSYRTPGELHAAEENAGISIQSESAAYLVAVIRIETAQILKDLGVYRELLYALSGGSQTNRNRRLFSGEVEHHRIALLLVAPADSVDDYFRSTVADVLDLLGAGRESLLSIGCGRPVTDVLAVYRSLEDARHALALLHGN